MPQQILKCKTKHKLAKQVKYKLANQMQEIKGY